ncbi:hypothetical protein [Reichenbachiella sp.]|uniref:hypothetical protein n=1 Tax=Reichenbachiella sp. TaxID=2184521 RepID=UPI003B5B732E
MKIIKSIAIITLVVISVQCTSEKDKMERIELTAQIDSLSMSLSESQARIKVLLSENDDQVSLINNLKEDLLKAESKMKPKVVAPNEIRQLISDLHAGWEDLGKNKSKDALMSNFLEKYSINAVRFDQNKIPWAKQSNYKTFEEQLDVLMQGENVSLSFGRVEVLFSETNGELFSVAYTATARVFQGNKEIETKSIISVLSGRITDKARIGNYSWVSIDR